MYNGLSYYRQYTAAFGKFAERKRLSSADRAAVGAEFLAFARQPSIADDPLTAATAKLSAVEQLPRKDDARVDAALQEVADDERLGPNHRLRQYAMLNLANRLAAKGDLAGAQAHFQRTGLTEQQCALLGPTPALRRSGAGREDFPNEAAAYGFEGWVRLEFDIKADGRTGTTRAVIAYPPFVFVDAANRMSGGMRYETSYRPGGSVACSANTSTIRFVLGQ